jgi:hypothetical protein
MTDQLLIVAVEKGEGLEEEGGEEAGAEAVIYA